MSSLGTECFALYVILMYSVDYKTENKLCHIGITVYRVFRISKELVKEFLQFKTCFIHLTCAWKYPIVLLWKTEKGIFSYDFFFFLILNDGLDLIPISSL